VIECEVYAVTKQTQHVHRGVNQVQGQNLGFQELHVRVGPQAKLHEQQLQLQKDNYYVKKMLFESSRFASHFQ
jgi:hypothetical protein